ncbi:MAG: hypothetical protein GF416_06450 [Candidatus Altiarchaeales archaeon]|nr:hypothetical protein [Candidatus Altiarchaeales archaeon]MBD3416755.1 hypothetical protein [Candidatus Altiarchaeales archaeon]
MGVEREGAHPPSQEQPMFSELMGLGPVEKQMAVYLMSVIFRDANTPDFDARLGRMMSRLGFSPEEIRDSYFVPPLEEVLAVEVGERDLPHSGGTVKLPVMDRNLSTSKGPVECRIVGTSHGKRHFVTEQVTDASRRVLMDADGHEHGFPLFYGVEGRTAPLDMSKEIMPLLSPEMTAQFGLKLIGATIMDFAAETGHPLAETFTRGGRYGGRRNLQEGMWNSVSRFYETREAMSGNQLRYEWNDLIARSAEQAHSIASIAEAKTGRENIACSFIVGAGHLPFIGWFLDHPRERNMTLLQMSNLAGPGTQQ